MKQNILALISGIIFGIGLCHSEMVNPAVVIGFLDITGSWNPALLGVMGGALAVTGVTFRFISTKGRTFCRTGYQLPVKTEIDRALIIGSVLFGAGWGISGICPGPAVTVMAYFQPETGMFFAAMLAGMTAYRIFGSKIRL